MRSVIKTPRCLARPLVAADFGTIVELMVNAEARRFLGGPVAQDVAVERAKAILDPIHDRVWAVSLAESDRDESVGVVTIHPHHDGQDHEISYQFLPSSWGRRIASEAVNSIAVHAFEQLGFDRLVAETQCANRSSRSLLARIGAVPMRRVVRFGAVQIIYALNR